MTRWFFFSICIYMVVSKKNFQKLAIKHDGHPTKIAREAKITPQAVSHRLKHNPLIKQKILNVREEALKKAGLSRAFVYRGIKEGCQANIIVVDGNKATKTKIADHSIRHKFLKTSLELHKDLDPDKEQSVQNIGAIIFQVLHNPNRERIQVV